MKIDSHYLLKEIDNICYLLPYGQAIADTRRGIRLNETGVFLWEHLEAANGEEELTKMLAAYIEAMESELPQLREDVHAFLNRLRGLHILQPEYLPIQESRFFQNIRIADIRIRLEGPSYVFHKSFDAFFESTDEQQQCDMTVTVLSSTLHAHKTGQLLLHNSQLLVIDCEDYYDILFLINQEAKELYLSKDGTHATFFCHAPVTDTFQEELFHAIRLAFLYCAGNRGMVALHSASLLYRDKAWLFTGHSGVGKSTHTKLWHTAFHTPLLNGDLNLLALKDGQPVIYGIPWCGTSEIFDTHTYPLGGIILLSRSDDNTDSSIEYPLSEKQLLINQRLISPSWTEALFEQNWAVTNSIAPHIYFCRLSCTKNPSAAQYMKNKIDQFLA